MHPIAVPCCALLLLAACSAPSKDVSERAPPARTVQEVSAPVPATQVDSKQAALDAIRSAAAAVASWRAELAVGEELGTADAAQLRTAVQSLSLQIGPLMAGAEEREAQSSRDPRRNEEQQLSMNAWAVSKEWTDAVRSLGEGAPQKRAAALDEVRAALTGTDATRQLAALQTLQRVGDVEYDKASFRPLVLPFAREAKGPTLVAALYALFNTEHVPEDLALVHAAWERDPQGMDEVLHLLFMFGEEGRIEGRSEQIALECLAQVESQGMPGGINGLWGARVGPALEARVLELYRSNDREVHHKAIYFGLSTFLDKGEAVVDALIETLSDPDFNNSGRALWGLGHGVPTALQPKVAAALVDLHNNRSDQYLRENCKRIVAQYGGPEYESKLLK